MTVRELLWRRVIAEMPETDRVAFCCAGKFLDRHWDRLVADLAPRQVVAILDDDPGKQQTGYRNHPVLPLATAAKCGADAVIITTDRLEDEIAHVLRGQLADETPILFAGRVEANPSVTPAMVAHVLDDPSLDRNARRTLSPDNVPDTPDLIGLEITTGCNLNCTMCETHSATRPTGQMSLEQFARGLEELDANGCRVLTLHTIGEPTIHKHLANILGMAHERRFETFLSTNGMLIDRHIDALTRWPVAVLRWSVDGATRDTYECIRVGGKFARLLQNLALLRETIDRETLPTRMCMQATLSAENLHEVPDFFETYGRFIDDDGFSFAFVNSLSAGDGNYFAANRLLRNEASQVPCPLIWQSMYVGIDGRVSACCRDYHGDLIVGDLRENSACQIWHGPQLTRLRELHAAEDFEQLPQACQTCYAAPEHHAELLSAMIAALRREQPAPTRAAFTERLTRFVQRLSVTATNPETAPVRQPVSTTV